MAIEYNLEIKIDAKDVSNIFENDGYKIIITRNCGGGGGNQVWLQPTAVPDQTISWTEKYNLFANTQSLQPGDTITIGSNPLNDVALATWYEVDSNFVLEAMTKAQIEAANLGSPPPSSFDTYVSKDVATGQANVFITQSAVISSVNYTGVVGASAAVLKNMTTTFTPSMALNVFISKTYRQNQYQVVISGLTCPLEFDPSNLSHVIHFNDNTNRFDIIS